MLVIETLEIWGYVSFLKSFSSKSLKFGGYAATLKVASIKLKDFKAMFVF